MKRSDGKIRPWLLVLSAALACVLLGGASYVLGRGSRLSSSEIHARLATQHAADLREEHAALVKARAVDEKAKAGAVASAGRSSYADGQSAGVRRGEARGVAEGEAIGASRGTQKVNQEDQRRCESAFSSWTFTEGTGEVNSQMCESV